MKICAISDLHGLIGKDIKIDKCDLLLIAGDTVDLSIQKNFTESMVWFGMEFKPFIKTLPCDKIIMIGGNHDFYLEYYSNEFREGLKNSNSNIVYLENEYYEYKGITIYGTPLCHKFMNWAFMPDDSTQRNIFNKTMDNRHIDIFLSHDAPYGYSDICYESSYGRDHIGNPVLYDVAMEKNPTYFIHGHLHSSNHEFEELPNEAKTKVANVSLLGEDYKLQYEPLYIEL